MIIEGGVSFLYPGEDFIFSSRQWYLHLGVFTHKYTKLYRYMQVCLKNIPKRVKL